ncbi:MAG: hypothetical protein KAJ19_26850 [Gammaproteobacteria bacterium]|nr:hypothetical protein [Gammaproteobacteria bacterium]
MDIEKINTDIQKIKKIEETHFNKHGCFLQVLPTPEILPLESEIINTESLNTPAGDVPFVPVAKNVQYIVRVANKPSSEETGAIIIARYDIGNGLTDEVVEQIGSLKIKSQRLKHEF